MASRNSKNIFKLTNASALSDPPHQTEGPVGAEVMAEATASKARIRARLKELASRFAGPISTPPAQSSEESVDDQDRLQLIPADHG